MERRDIEEFLRCVDEDMQGEVRRLLEDEMRRHRAMRERKEREKRIAQREVIESRIFNQINVVEDRWCEETKQNIYEGEIKRLKLYQVNPKPLCNEIVAVMEPSTCRETYARMFKAAPQMVRLLLQIKDSNEQGQCENWFNKFPERINQLLVSVFTDEDGPWYDNVDETMMPKHLRSQDYTGDK